jgi:hypothetical protein
MKIQFLRLAKMLRIAIAIVALVTIGVACRQETVLNIFLQDKTPPSFTFSANGLAANFEILELPRTKPLSKIDPYSFKGETIWKISAPGKIKADKWPGVTYGDVPNGFSQTFPEHGPPRKLAEDKLYVAEIVEGKDSQSALFFVVRNGRPVNVTDEVFGP